MSTYKPRVPRLTGGIVLGVIGAIALSSCGTGATAEDENTGGESVSWGSSSDEFAAALDEMEPIELTYSSLTSPQSNRSLQDQFFKDYVEEYSDGKITVDITWAAAAGDFENMNTQVSSGIVDMGMFGPYYHPEEFPVSGLVAPAVLTPAMGGNPVGDYLTAQASSLSFAFEEPAYLEELEDGTGLKVLWGSELSYPQALVCSGTSVNNLDEITGRQVGVNTTPQGNEVSALGATPVSIARDEIYSSLQRGAMDCHVGSPAMHMSLGTFEIVDNWIIDPEAAWAATSNAMVISDDFWSQLPLAAQQVIFDGALRAAVEAGYAQWEDWHEAIETAAGHGVEITEFDQDMRSALIEAQQTGIDLVRSGDVAGGLLTDPNATADLAQNLLCTVDLIEVGGDLSGGQSPGRQ